MDRELNALIRAISVKTGPRNAAQHEIDALQSAYAVGRELLRIEGSLGADELAVRVNDWFGATDELVKRIGSKNEAFPSPPRPISPPSLPARRRPRRCCSRVSPS